MYGRGLDTSCWIMIVRPSSVRTTVVDMSPMSTFCSWCQSPFGQRLLPHASKFACLESIVQRQSSLSPRLTFMYWLTGPRPCVGYWLPMCSAFHLSLQCP